MQVRKFSIWRLNINFHTSPFSNLRPMCAHLSLSFQVLHTMKNEVGKNRKEEKESPQALQWAQQ